MIVNVISESKYFKERFGGIHSAFLNHLALLKKIGVTSIINSSQKADILHVHSFGPFAIYKLLTKKTPAVIVTHSIPESLIGSYKGAGYFKGIITKFFIFFYNQADLILAVSPQTKRDVEKLGVKPRIVVLSNHINDDLFKVDPSLRQAGRKELGLSDTDIVVIGVGRQAPRKGIIDFIETAKKFPDLKFLWTGGREVGMMEALQPNEKELLDNPPKNVILPGVVPYKDMAKMYNSADIILFPSYQETQGLVIIEGAACGLPVVIRDLPEYKELYQDTYIACKTLEDFANAVDKLSKDKEFYTKQQQKSRELAKRFESGEIGRQLRMHYESLIQKAPKEEKDEAHLNTQ